MSILNTKQTWLKGTNNYEEYLTPSTAEEGLSKPASSKSNLLFHSEDRSSTYN
jgi:hypothetical protein